MSNVEDLSKTELLALLETVEQISTEADPQKLVETILNSACRLTHSPDGSILLLDPERNELYFSAVRGETAGILLENFGQRSEGRVSLAGSVAGDTFTSRTIKTLERAKHFEEVDRQTGKKTESILSAPLCARGKVIGVLQLLNKTDSDGKLVDYDAHDSLLVEQFGRQAAIAIDNAQLVAKLLAHMGLYSRNSEDLAARINKPAEKERLALLFADMRGFTQLCQSLQAPQIQKIVNELLTMFAEQVLNSGGIVNKFMGDSVFAIFRQPDGPERAVRCAFAMIERFTGLRSQWDQELNPDLSFLDLGVGIVTEDAAFGTVGSAEVRDFTAIGTAVNLAKAFEASARDGKRVLVDQATWKAVQSMISDWERLPQFELRKPGQALGVKFHQYHLKRIRPEPPIQVFVSHSSKNREIVDRIIDQLKRFGMGTWCSNEDIPAGEKYAERIRAGLMSSDWVLVLVSADSVKSDWVRAEVKAAMADLRFKGRILPLALDESSAAQINPDLAELQSLNGRVTANLGEKIGDDILAREKKLRSTVVVESPK
jgi:adenylate cyclase